MSKLKAKERRKLHREAGLFILGNPISCRHETDNAYAKKRKPRHSRAEVKVMISIGLYDEVRHD